MNQEKLVKFVKFNYDYVLGFIVFISYRYFFTWLLWHGRGVPPISDNAYFYLSSAHNLFNLQNFEQFRLVVFSVFLNVLGLITKGNLESAFKLNFYIGPIIMFFALAFFLKKLEASKNIRLLLLIIMSLYSGSGAYHGFYWVVPSFYQTALFFVILGFLVSKTKVNFWRVLIASFLFIFIHPTSIFVSAVFFAYFFIASILYRTDDVLKSNFKRLIFSLLGIYAIYYLVGRIFPSAGSPESFQTNSSLVKDFLTGRLAPISLPVIWQEYFAIFFFNPLSILAYFLMFCSVASVRQAKMLTLFISSALLVVAGAFIPYGARTLEFLWPLTFIVVGYALVGLFRFMGKLTSFIKYLTIAPLVSLIVFATIFNSISIETLNAAKDYSWDRSCPAKLNNSKTFFTNPEALYAFNVYGLNQNSGIFLTEDKLPLLKEGTYLVQPIDTPQPKVKLSGLEEFLVKKITRRKEPVKVQFPQNSWTQNPTSNQLLYAKLAKNNLVTNLAYDCQKFIIYKIKSI